jgi:hypothetical protein
MSTVSDLNELLNAIMDDDLAYVVDGPRELDKLAWCIAAAAKRRGELDPSLHIYLEKNAETRTDQP